LSALKKGKLGPAERETKPGFLIWKSKERGINVEREQLYCQGRASRELQAG